MKMPNVFVVDDEEPICRAFQLLLNIHGYSVRTFCSAAAFLTAHHSELEGVLFVDVYMPQMNGRELYAELRKRNTRLTMVLMTGHESVNSLHQLFGQEVEVLEKPFSASELLRILNVSVPEVGNRGSNTLRAH